MVTNMLSRWVKMFFLMGTMEVRKSLRRMKMKPPTRREKTTRPPDITSPTSIICKKRETAVNSDVIHFVICKKANRPL